MRLTAFSDYTLRALIYLALRPDKLCTIDEIAEAFDISANHLTKVVHQAALAGDIATVRGQHGGLRLGRPANTINIGVVVRRTEPDFAVAPCFNAGDACAIRPGCVLQGVLGDALEAFLTVLDKTTLADLVRPRRKLSSLLDLEPAA
jgi:Rrf2 family transcriptional regulator, nitric oxide-sensitive transcriptional repressor